MRFRLLCVPVALAVLTPAASAQTSAVVDIDTTQTTPLNPGFSGFNDEVVFPAEYFDYRLNNLAAQLSASWVRYPSGLFSDAFNWQTGLMVPSWMSQFQTTSLATLLNESVPWVNGKGGGSFADAARPSAVVAVFAIDAGDTSSNPAWDRALAAYPNKYWDAVTFHHYPPQSTGASASGWPTRTPFWPLSPQPISPVIWRPFCRPEPGLWNRSSCRRTTAWDPALL